MLKLFGWGKEASDEEEEEDESPLAVSSPRDFRRGIHVSHDTASNTFTGVPSAWRNAVPNSASESAAEEDGDLPEYLVPSARKPAVGILGGVGAGIGALLSRKKETEAPDLAISRPTGFRHVTHVTVDPDSDVGFTGLPDEWLALLKGSGISKEETMQNPQVVLDVLEFQAGGGRRPAPPRKADFREARKSAVEFRLQDPNLDLRDLTIVGQGSSGAVYLGVERETGRQVAVKRFATWKTTDIAALENEIAMMNLSRHPNVVDYIGLSPPPASHRRLHSDPEHFA
ncbi:P21-Rho-binding domain-containing protein [Baffinella frigidus]|nr:P21-Rho-binding domain-containing protein [Cryptophyta sp. CCMP2293]